MAIKLMFFRVSFGFGVDDSTDRWGGRTRTRSYGTKTRRATGYTTPQRNGRPEKSSDAPNHGDRSLYGTANTWCYRLHHPPKKRAAREI